jgi:hypothetical protein
VSSHRDVYVTLPPVLRHACRRLAAGDASALLSYRCHVESSGGSLTRARVEFEAFVMAGDFQEPPPATPAAAAPPPSSTPDQRLARDLSGIHEE